MFYTNTFSNNFISEDLSSEDIISNKEPENKNKSGQEAKKSLSMSYIFGEIKDSAKNIKENISNLFNKSSKSKLNEYEQFSCNFLEILKQDVERISNLLQKLYNSAKINTSSFSLLEETLEQKNKVINNISSLVYDAVQNKKLNSTKDVYAILLKLHDELLIFESNVLKVLLDSAYIELNNFMEEVKKAEACFTESELEKYSTLLEREYGKYLDYRVKYKSIYEVASILCKESGAKNGLPSLKDVVDCCEKKNSLASIVSEIKNITSKAERIKESEGGFLELTYSNTNNFFDN